MVDSSIILDLLSKTNISKIAGIYKLSGTFIKDGAESIANHFTKIMSLSIASFLFPDLCKIAKLIALFKKGLRQRIIALFLFYHFFQRSLKKLSTFKQKNFLITITFYMSTSQVLGHLTDSISLKDTIRVYIQV